MPRLRCLLSIVLWFMVATILSGQDKPAPDNQAMDDPQAEIDQLKPRVELETGGHTAEVMKLFFTRDGKQIVTLGSDQSIRYWDAETGEPRRVLRFNFFLNTDAHACSAALSPDGKTLALFAAVKTKETHKIILFDIEQGRIDRIFETNSSGETCLSFSSDGKLLAMGLGSGHDVMVALIDVSTGTKVLKIKHDPKRPEDLKEDRRSLTFSPDGKRLAFGTGSSVHIVDLASGDVETILDNPCGYVRAVAWAPKEPILAISGNQQAAIWDASSRKIIKTVEISESACLTWSADGKQLLLACLNKGAIVHLIDVSSGKSVQDFRLKPPNPTPHDAAFSPDGERVAFVGGNFHSLCLRSKDGKELWTVRGKGSPVVSCGWSPDGKTLVLGQGAGMLSKPPRERPFESVFDLVRLQLPGIATLSEHDRINIHRQALELDGVELVPKSGATTIDRGGDVLKIEGTAYFGPGIGNSLLPGNRVAIGGWRGDIAIFETIKGKKTGNLWGHKGPIEELALSPNGKYLLSASLDQTLKVWNIADPGQEKPLLTLFIAGPDWIIWTPEGYYAATPGGERLMGWTIFQGYDKLKLFYPAERFRKQMYRPDVIKLVLETGSVPEALKLANAALKKEGIAVSEGSTEISKLLPPQVTLTLVKKTDDGVVTLRAEATPGCKEQPVVSMHVLVDGHTLPDNQGRSLNAREEWTLTLPPGQHRVTVLARSADVPGISNALEIDSRPLKDKPRMHVLAIGINDYNNKDLNLRTAANDATLLAGTLQTACKGDLYGEVHAQTLLNKDATTAAVLEKIRGLKEKTTNPERGKDLVIIYFAGHGVKEGRQFYLLTHEADVKNLAKTALSGEALQESLEGFPCQVLVILDACHSDAFAKGGVLAGKERATDEATNSLANDRLNVMVMCAAHGVEEALEKDGQGLFTKAVVEALIATKDLAYYDRRNQRQYLEHIDTYTKDRVREWSDNKQHPYLKIPETIVDQVPLRKLPPASSSQR